MIEFKSSLLKNIFYITFALLAIVGIFLVVTAYLNPSSAMGLLQIIMFQFFCTFLPLLVLVLALTKPTLKNTSGKKGRAGIWIPVLTFAILGGLAVGLMTLQSNGRCTRLEPGGALWDCDFSGMDLSGSDLKGADMARISLVGANLSGSDLSGAILENSNLSGSDLSSANLNGANLFQANLDGTNLSGTSLDGTTLQLASLVNAQGLSTQALANLESWNGLRLESEDEMLATLWPVCSGQGVEQAADYLPGQQLNSIILIMGEGKSHELSSGALWGSYWISESVSNTELVACLSLERVEIDQCTYDDGVTFARLMQREDISIFEAKTGKLVMQLSIEGPRPNNCPPKVVAGGDYADMVGEHPGGRAIIDALAPFVNEAGVLPPLNAP